MTLKNSVVMIPKAKLKCYKFSILFGSKLMTLKNSVVMIAKAKLKCSNFQFYLPLSWWLWKTQLWWLPRRKFKIFSQIPDKPGEPEPEGDRGGDYGSPHLRPPGEEAAGRPRPRAEAAQEGGGGEEEHGGGWPEDKEVEGGGRKGLGGGRGRAARPGVHHHLHEPSAHCTIGKQCQSWAFWVYGSTVTSRPIQV